MPLILGIVSEEHNASSLRHRDLFKVWSSVIQGPSVSTKLKQSISQHHGCVQKARCTPFPSEFSHSDMPSDDFLFNESKRNETEAIFAARKDKSDYVPYELVLYKGTFDS
jgi:hypothetical protein